MKKYYLHNGKEQEGPFSVDDLKSKQINRDTPIWYEGISEWTTAEKIDELKELIKTTPPPINKQTAQKETQQPEKPVKPKKKRKIGKIIAIIITIIIVIFLIIGGFYVAYEVGRYSNGETCSESQQNDDPTLHELNTPTYYLTVTGKYEENFWGDEFDISLAITNNATSVTYKDAVIKVTYYTKTGTVLGEKKHVVYEIFPPNSTKVVELTIDNYENVSSLGWEVISAKSTK